MKTTEQINQIKFLKGFIAELVTKHKETKTNRSREVYLGERPKLFILYQVYYILRHEVSDIDAYANELESHLKPHKQNHSWPFEKFGMKLEGIRDWQSYGDNIAEAIKLTIKHLEKYVDSKSE